MFSPNPGGYVPEKTRDNTPVKGATGYWGFNKPVVTLRLDCGLEVREGGGGSGAGIREADRSVSAKGGKLWEEGRFDASIRGSAPRKSVPRTNSLEFSSTRSEQVIIWIPDNSNLISVPCVKVFSKPLERIVLLLFLVDCCVEVLGYPPVVVVQRRKFFWAQRTLMCFVLLKFFAHEVFEVFWHDFEVSFDIDQIVEINPLLKKEFIKVGLAPVRNTAFTPAEGSSPMSVKTVLRMKPHVELFPLKEESSSPLPVKKTFPLLLKDKGFAE
ncbi:60S ribosomal protein L23a [Striga asiatica]|uniref:60S ribosomal protein L23a n=1 Tax=Striga asiatica TaxID=4170 RepID=A0A5A7QIJ6_STRAF|nr:60S ribosomal protein L23a [Striga asiatica]